MSTSAASTTLTSMSVMPARAETMAMAGIGPDCVPHSSVLPSTPTRSPSTTAKIFVFPRIEQIYMNNKTIICISPRIEQIIYMNNKK
jgi:hypothetical protein